VLGFTVPALARSGETASLAEQYEHRWRPVSAGLAVPAFALFAAGVSLSLDSLEQAVREPAAQGVALGLIVGKPVGILLATTLLIKFTHARLHPTVRWLDLVAVSVIAGIGFTVSLLIGELSFEPGSATASQVKTAVLLSSLAAAAIGAALLKWRGHRRHHTAESDHQS
jgi:NhaA family Na+:H+ antiporter